MSGTAVRLAMLIGGCAAVCAGCSGARRSPRLCGACAGDRGARGSRGGTPSERCSGSKTTMSSRILRARTATTSTSRATTTSRIFLATASSRSTAAACFWGRIAVRQYQHNLTPSFIGPREGSLFNHMHLQPVIHVAPDGQTANVRSRPFIMFGIHGVRAQWGSGVYENRFVKEDGVWKFAYLHGYWTFYTDYEDGWTRRAVPMFGQYERLPPDRPQSVSYGVIRPRSWRRSTT